MPDPSQDGGPSAPAQQAPQASGDDLSTQWSNWLDRPGNRSALMQFGIAMLQPIQQGQSFAGHIGEAIGQGGEAEARVAAQGRLQQEAESKEQLRGMQADLAGARAGSQAALSEAAGTRAAAQAQNLQSLMQRRQDQTYLGLNQDYQRFLVDKHKTESEPLGPNRGVGTPDPSFEEYLQSRGVDPRRFVTGGGGGGEDLQVNPPPQNQPVPTSTLANTEPYRSRIAQAKAAIRTNPQLARQLIDNLKDHVTDPENLPKLFGG